MESFLAATRLAKRARNRSKYVPVICANLLESAIPVVKEEMRPSDIIQLEETPVSKVYTLPEGYRELSADEIAGLEKYT